MAEPNSQTPPYRYRRYKSPATYDSLPGYLIFDRATNFNKEVIDTVRSFGIQPKRTSFRSPRQNGVAERWIGNCRRDLIDHVIVVNERLLKRLMNEYVRYHHKIEPISRSRRVLQRVVKEPRIPMQVVGSYPCQDLAGCITATI